MRGACHRQLRVFGDLVDLVRDESVSLAVDADRGVRVGGSTRHKVRPFCSSTQ